MIRNFIVWPKKVSFGADSDTEKKGRQPIVALSLAASFPFPGTDLGTLAASARLPGGLRVRTLAPLSMFYKPNAFNVIDAESVQRLLLSS
jgi:hypothetical protein